MLSDNIKTLYLLFRKTSKYQSWQSSDLGLGASIYKEAICPFPHVLTKFMATKLSRIDVWGEGLPATESY